MIIYHLDSRWCPAGFLGVDIYFTLLGYLIASWLLIERDRTGISARPGF